jgi:hypothetical protein
MASAACRSASVRPSSFWLSPTPQIVAAMPDTIPCNHAVKVEARTDADGVAQEYRWLNAYYPDHSQTDQRLDEGAQSFDVLSFTRSNGHRASVCFDITSFMGRS